MPKVAARVHIVSHRRQDASCSGYPAERRETTPSPGVSHRVSRTRTTTTAAAGTTTARTRYYYYDGGKNKVDTARTGRGRTGTTGGDNGYRRELQRLQARNTTAGTRLPSPSPGTIRTASKPTSSPSATDARENIASARRLKARVESRQRVNLDSKNEKRQGTTSRQTNWDPAEVEPQEYYIKSQQSQRITAEPQDVKQESHLEKTKEDEAESQWTPTEPHKQYDTTTTSPSGKAVKSQWISRWASREDEAKSQWTATEPRKEYDESQWIPAGPREDEVMSQWIPTEPSKQYTKNTRRSQVPGDSL
ncbi:hypothetical protein K438DRAFT_1768977 [Mycena galopus ATCC 62051]|nr:hypothetical protein K438DRAFT_1768977 [Mycena galopus ATCC 62051]